MGAGDHLRPRHWRARLPVCRQAREGYDRLTQALILVVLLAAAPWQQSVRYDIRAALDASVHTLTATERVVYRNNSPDALRTLWFHLYPNAFRSRTTAWARESERIGDYRFSWAPHRDRGGLDLRVVAAADRAVRFQVHDTELELMLDRPLAPGDSVQLDFDFTVRIPALFALLGHQGRHYELAQWYPQVAVYDQAGWHADGCHALARSPGEFATYDVALLVPARMVVGATGELVGNQVERAWQRLAPSLRRSATPARSAKTLEFHAERVRDFAWIADEDYQVIELGRDSLVIRLLVQRRHARAWQDVPAQVLGMVDYLGQRCGPYGYRSLTIAEAFAPAGSRSFPNLVLVAQQPTSLLRTFEQALIQQVSRQWFGDILGTDRLREPWLEEGVTEWLATGYLADLYGPADDLLVLPSPLDLRLDVSPGYVDYFLYYLANANHLDRPVRRSSLSFTDEAALYGVTVSSKASLVLEMLRRALGDSLFGAGLRRYCEEYRFRHPTTDDLRAAMRATAGQDLAWLEPWLATDRSADNGVGRVRRCPTADGPCWETEIRRPGLLTPLEVEIEFAGGATRTFHLPDTVGPAANILVTSERPRRIAVDPGARVLDRNRFDNYWPRRVTLNPLFDVPRFDAYQLFWGPYVGHDGYSGWLFGLWLQGRRLFAHDLMKGAHQWNVTGALGTERRNLDYAVSYATPVPFAPRTIFGATVLRSGGENDVRTSLTRSLGRPIDPVTGSVALAYTFESIKRLVGRDARDWQVGDDGFLALTARRRWEARLGDGSERVEVRRASTGLIGGHDYWRGELELNERLRLGTLVTGRVRAFFGQLLGSGPPQAEFFLSGRLRPDDDEPWKWSYTGFFGTQDHWHVSGDANLAGYAGQHRRGPAACAVNVVVPVFVRRGFELAFFADAGNVADQPGELWPLRADAGVRVAIGPFYGILPFWVSQPAASETNLGLRWVVGFVMPRLELPVLR